MNKSRFAGLAKARLQAIEQEGQPSTEQEGNTAIKQARKKAVKQARKKASKPASKKASKVVGITIRVDEELRHHWSIQARMERTTITDAIIECLTKRFGTPKKAK